MDRVPLDHGVARGRRVLRIRRQCLRQRSWPSQRDEVRWSCRASLAGVVLVARRVWPFLLRYSSVDLCGVRECHVCPRECRDGALRIRHSEVFAHAAHRLCTASGRAPTQELVFKFRTPRRAVTFLPRVQGQRTSLAVFFFVLHGAVTFSCEEHFIYVPVL